MARGALSGEGGAREKRDFLDIKGKTYTNSVVYKCGLSYFFPLGTSSDLFLL